MVILALAAAVGFHQCAAFVHPSALLGVSHWPSEHRAASYAPVRLSDFCLIKMRDMMVSYPLVCHVTPCHVARWPLLIDVRRIVAGSHLVHGLDLSTPYV